METQKNKRLCLAGLALLGLALLCLLGLALLCFAWLAWLGLRRLLTYLLGFLGLLGLTDGRPANIRMACAGDMT